MRQTGQTIIILLLIMLVALSIGLVVTQRSLTDLTSSTQTDQSSRAFSAAEAGIEQAIQLCPPGVACNNIPASDKTIQLGNQSSSDITISGALPATGQLLEYPPIKKEEFAQFWLASPEDINDTSNSYNEASFEFYFGNIYDYSSSSYEAEQPAVEVNVVLKDESGKFGPKRFYLDSNNTRRDKNGFISTVPTCRAGGYAKTTVNLTNASDSNFYCRATISYSLSSPCFPGSTGGCRPILVRVRPLYSNLAHKMAIEPNPGKSLPPQASIYTSIGNSGQSQKTIRVFRMKYVVPQFFDFAIFSAGPINKN